MPEPTVDPADLLRQAAEVAPSVLPKEIAELVAWYLNGTAESREMWPVAPVLAREVLALAQPGQIEPASVELTPEQVEEFKARFEAVRHEPPTLITAASTPDTPGHHVMVTVDSRRNHGAASISRNMTPIWSAAGLLWAGDSLEVVRDEFDLTEPEAAVVFALAEDFEGLAKDTSEEQLRTVYRERAQLVAVLAHFYPSVWAYSDPAEPEWPVVYIDTPAGQCSWHLSANDLDLFGHVDSVPADDPHARWDGHSTEEKHQRLAELSAMPKCSVSWEQVRAAAEALFWWNIEQPTDPRFVIHRVAEGGDKEPYEALLEKVLELLGVEVIDE